MYFFGINRLESGLVRLAVVRPLFNFDHLGRLEHLESVTTVGQQEHVALVQYAALQVGLLIVVEVYPHPAGFNEQDLFGVVHLPSNRVMDMRWNHMTLRPVHIPKLLGEVIRCEESDTLQPIPSMKYDGQRAPSVPDVFEHITLV
jgi:hypothetical protein